MPATGMPPGGWPSCWPSAATWTGPSRSCAPGPTPATRYAAWRLAELLAERGDLDGLRARADAGDGDAAWQLAELLAERGDLDGLRARADAGDGAAARRLAELLAERGDLDGLRARADAGDEAAAWRLAGLLAERGDLDGAPDPARPGRRRRRGMPPGGWPSCWPSAATWTRLRARADAGDGDAASRLAGLLAERGDLDGLRARADAGDGHAARRLAELLAERATWTSCAPGPTPATGTPPCGWPGCWPSAATWTGPVCAPGPTPATRHAARRLAELLAERGDLDGLRARADAGDGYAAARLAGLLAERGDLDGLRARADARRRNRRRGNSWPTC